MTHAQRFKPIVAPTFSEFRDDVVTEFGLLFGLDLSEEAVERVGTIDHADLRDFVTHYTEERIAGLTNGLLQPDPSRLADAVANCRETVEGMVERGDLSISHPIDDEKILRSLNDAFTLTAEKMFGDANPETLRPRSR